MIRRAYSMIAAICLIASPSCSDPECPAYLRSEGADCVVPGPSPDAGGSDRDTTVEQALPQSESGTGSDAGGKQRARSAAQDPASKAEQQNDAGVAENMEASSASSSAMSIAPSCGNGVREGTELCDGVDCVLECASDNACIITQLKGSAKTCDAQCITRKIEACKSGDKCCPTGCDYGTDTDCSPSCGDGELTATETCEPGSAKYPCPSVASCDDGDVCTEDSVTGSSQQCSAKCAHAPITREAVDCDDHDPCTDDTSAESPSACVYECAHSSSRRPTGSCDDNDPCTDDTPVLSKSRCAYDCPHTRMQPPAANCDDGNPCTDDTSTMSSARCALECLHAPVRAGMPCGSGRMCNASGKCEAPPSLCGDGVVSQDEECDPSGPGFSPFNCSEECRRITAYTHCGAGWPECLNGTVCNLGLCSRMCTTRADCDTVAGYPGLQATCPVPRGDVCVLECTSNADCPSGAVCNGGQICQAS